MSIELNHTIVGATDRHASARFLADILGLPVGPDAGPFAPVRLANGVTLDYMDRAQVAPQHYAFLVGDDEFDAAFGRIRDAGLPYFADPGFQQPGEINTRWGGRGVYFHDPDGHSMEILTRAP
jgi:catechol 2,3-dioxygenase-like lactoylglutathione lyase family enzyme